MGCLGEEPRVGKGIWVVWEGTSVGKQSNEGIKGASCM